MHCTWASLTMSWCPPQYDGCTRLVSISSNMSYLFTHAASLCTKNIRHWTKSARPNHRWGPPLTSHSVADRAGRVLKIFPTIWSPLKNKKCFTCHSTKFVIQDLRKADGGPRRPHVGEASKSPKSKSIVICILWMDEFLRFVSSSLMPSH